MVKTNQRQRKQSQFRGRVQNGRTAPNGRNGSNGAAKTPLLPVGVNNKVTMPQGAAPFRFRGSEVMTVISVVSSVIGERLVDTLISPSSVARLGSVASNFQRIKWHKAQIRIVPLNGSTTTAGYTAGVIEDPELKPGFTGKALLQFLTGLRATVVRQSWVASEAGLQVDVKDRPEMYVQQGTDVRRWSPGRFVMAAGGEITNASFQIHLDYDVSLFVPVPGVNADPEEGTFNTPANNNGYADTNVVRLPHTGYGDVFNGSSVTLDLDLVVSFILTDAQSVGHFGIIRAGTRVTLRAVGGFWQVDWNQKPPGQTAYLVRINTQGPLSTMSVVGASGPSNFITWVNTLQVAGASSIEQ